MSSISPDTVTSFDQSAERKLLLSARRLFCREGIHATGISRLLDEARVARRTLYLTYGSKENLLRAVFELEASMWYRWFDEQLPKCSIAPLGQVLTLFDLLKEWFGRDDFYGCIFLNAVAEHDKESGWVRTFALDHRRNVDRRVIALLQSAGAPSPERLTDKIAMVIDGAIIAAMVTGDASVADLARETTADLLTAAGLQLPI